MLKLNTVLTSLNLGGECFHEKKKKKRKMELQTTDEQEMILERKEQKQ